MVETIGNRIKAFIDSANITRSAFAERIGVSPAYVTMLIGDKNIPSDLVVNAICREFRISEKWLRTGEGKPYVDSPTSVVGQLATHYHLCPEAAAMVEKFVELEPTAQKTVFAYMCAVVDEIRGQTGPKTTDGMTDAEIAAAVRHGEDLEKEQAAQSEA